MGIKELRLAKQQKLEDKLRRASGTADFEELCEESDAVSKFCIVDDGSVVVIWQNGDHQTFMEHEIDRAMEVVRSQSDKK